VSNVVANPLIDLFHRLRSSVAWVAAQFWATLLLVLALAAFGLVIVRAANQSVVID